MASVYIKGTTNVAEITLPLGVDIHLKAKTNSKQTQKTTLPIADEVHVFSGTGEANNIIGDKHFTLSDKKPLHATFEYSNNDGVFKPCALKSGGPYGIGNYNIMVVVAENGDDSDFNDAILEFSWYTPKQQSSS